MEKRELTCIGCPLGCTLFVELDESGAIKVTGNSCRIGENYAIKECINPTRIITTTVLVTGGDCPTVPVKTEKDIPKAKIFDCLKALKGISIGAPVNIGDVVYENIENTGVNIVASKNISAKK